MSADKYLSIFSRQMEAIVYIYVIFCVGEKNGKIKIVSSFSSIKLRFVSNVLDNPAQSCGIFTDFSNLAYYTASSAKLYMQDN